MTNFAPGMLQPNLLQGTRTRTMERARPVDSSTSARIPLMRTSPDGHFKFRRHGIQKGVLSSRRDPCRLRIHGGRSCATSVMNAVPFGNTRARQQWRHECAFRPPPRRGHPNVPAHGLFFAGGFGVHYPQIINFQRRLEFCARSSSISRAERVVEVASHENARPCRFSTA